MVYEKGEECRAAPSCASEIVQNGKYNQQRATESAQACVWAVGKFYRMMADEPSWCGSAVTPYSC